VFYSLCGNFPFLGDWIIGREIDAAMNAVVVAALGEFYVKIAQRGFYRLPERSLF
jgi:hypothetical protein